MMATTSVQLQIKWGGGGVGEGSRIYNTGCRALLVKLGFGEENTSVAYDNHSPLFSNCVYGHEMIDY